MNALQMARTAYGANTAPIRTPRGVEYDAFARITSTLRSASTSHSDFPALASALHENRRLWTVLAADVADNDNGLPAGLRAQVFYLAEFAQHHTRKVLNGEATSEALIEINTAIMRGLRQSGQGG